MTALNEFERLECPGIWRSSPASQRRDVVVAIGDATLTISDANDQALSHWSLPAIERINPGRRPALFRPGPDALEVLEVSDDTLIQAMKRVHSVVKRKTPRRGRLRLGIGVAVFLVLSSLAIFWLPSAMIAYTARVVPDQTRASIGDQLLDSIQRISGQPCGEGEGTIALERLHTRLGGGERGQIVVLAGGVAQSGHLPGGTILLNRALVEDYEDVDVPAGFVIAELMRSRLHDPLETLLHSTGLGPTFKLLTTGQLPAESLQTFAEIQLSSPPAELNTDALLAAFEAASVRARAYAYAVDISGESTVAIIEGDRVTAQDAKPVLSDGDWVRLQSICGE